MTPQKVSLKIDFQQKAVSFQLWRLKISIEITDKNVNHLLTYHGIIDSTISS